MAFEYFIEEILLLFQKSTMSSLEMKTKLTLCPKHIGNTGATIELSAIKALLHAKLRGNG